MNQSLFYDSIALRAIEFHHHRYRDYRRDSGIDMHYFGCMEAGCARLTDGTTEIVVQPGELFYIPKGCHYQSFWYADGVGRFLSLGFRTYPNPANRIYRLQKIEMTPEEATVLRQLANNMQQVNSLSVGLLYVLMGLTETHMATELVDRHNTLVERAMVYMQRNIHLSVPEMAAYCGTSPSTLYHAFRKTLGKPPNQVWHEIQVQKATELLVTTDLPIEEISSRLAFSSSSHFRKVFFAQAGKTPREVRREGTFFSPPPRSRKDTPQ